MSEFKFPDRYRVPTPEENTSRDSHAFTERDLRRRGKRRLPDRNSERAVQIADLETDNSDSNSERQAPAMNAVRNPKALPTLPKPKSRFDGSETNPFRNINNARR